MIPFIRLGSLSILLGAILLGCGADAEPGSNVASASGCEPGEVVACTCASNAPGTQTCNLDGASLSSCQCGGAPSATDASPSPTGSPTAELPSEGPGMNDPATGGAGGAGPAPIDEPLPPEEPGGPIAVEANAASCTGLGLPATNDYGALGPFATVTIENTGPGGDYTMIRPTEPGKDGFVHPPVTWGNGILTTPAAYVILLNTIASHGFVIIASNSTNVTAALMTAGLDWLIAQNDAPGPLQGTLDTDCAVTIGYSLGGGAAVTAGSHPKVVTTVSFHGLQGPAEDLHSPLLLLTSTNDGFVTKAGYTVPTYNRSSVVPTLMATLEVPGAVPDFDGHLIPLNDAGEERAPAVAWLRYWVLGDAGARHYFFGNDCVVCQTPWTDIQRKNYDWN
jgi:hypothetical protein